MNSFQDQNRNSVQVQMSMEDEFLSKILKYNLSDLSSKSYFQIMVDGLETYSSAKDCSCVSLFLFDKDSLEFIFKLAIPLESEDSEIKKFDKMRLQGSLTPVLSGSEVVTIESVEENEKIVILPLAAHTGIIGLILITFRITHPLAQKFIDILTVFSCQFAVNLYSYKLQLDIDFMNENREQIIALKTRNIAKSTSEIKYILDSVQMGIIIIDKTNDTITSANTLAAQVIGLSKDKLIGQKRSEFFSLPIDRKIGEIIPHREASLKKNNGIIIPIICATALITLEDRQYYIESFFDITERKKMEMELRFIKEGLELRVKERTEELVTTNKSLMSEIERRIVAEADLQKFYWAVQQSPVMISLCDINGIIEYVNPRFSEITGFSYSDVIGGNMRILKSGDRHREEYLNFWKDIRSGIIWQGEHTNKKKNGEIFWVSTLVSPIYNAKGEITNFVAVQEDITIKREAQRHIILAKEKAEESDRIKTSIMANMSHELRTPLIGILGFTQILLEEITDESHLLLIWEIEHSGQRLLQTLNSLLYVSQLEAGNSSDILSTVAVCETVKSLAAKFAGNSRSKGLELSVFAPENEIHIRASKELIEVVFTHLIDNAIKFTDEGSINVSIEIRSLEDNLSMVLISIKDTGIGIEESDKQMIFEPFRQQSEGYSRSFQGTGLGLTLVKKIVELSGGRITLESEVNVGSVFSVWLPVV